MLNEENKVTDENSLNITDDFEMEKIEVKEESNIKENLEVKDNLKIDNYLSSEILDVKSFSGNEDHLILDNTVIGDELDDNIYKNLNVIIFFIFTSFLYPLSLKNYWLNYKYNNY